MSRAPYLICGPVCAYLRVFMSEAWYSHVTCAPSQQMGRGSSGMCREPVNYGGRAGRGFWFLITSPVYFTATPWGKTERGTPDHKSPVTLLLHLFHSIFPSFIFLLLLFCFVFFLLGYTISLAATLTYPEESVGKTAAAAGCHSDHCPLNMGKILK